MVLYTVTQKVNVIYFQELYRHNTFEDIKHFIILVETGVNEYFLIHHMNNHFKCKDHHRKFRKHIHVIGEHHGLVKRRKTSSVDSILIALAISRVVFLWSAFTSDFTHRHYIASMKV